MSDHNEDLPEFYITDDRQRIAMPTYEAMAQCQIIMVGANGVPGPTLVEPGEIFSTEASPSHVWKPLNRAAGEAYDRWLSSLPASGANIPQELITQAAYIMRPREGEAEIPHDQWWGAVMKLAAKLANDKQGNNLQIPNPASAHRPGGSKVPVMPFAGAVSSTPLDQVGRAPENLPRQHAPRGSAQRQRPQSPMPNAAPTNSPSQTTG